MMIRGYLYHPQQFNQSIYRQKCGIKVNFTRGEFARLIISVMENPLEPIILAMASLTRLLPRTPRGTRFLGTVIGHIAVP